MLNYVMNKKTRAAIALSGGVDSSVAALMLKEQGYDVTGVHIQLQASNFDTSKVVLAEAVARRIGIPFFLFDLSVLFKAKVIDYCAFELIRGHTPSPCIVCNRNIKFGELLRLVNEQLGIEYLATGHYARIRIQNDRKFKLLKAKSINKDQSYFLHQLTQAQLQHVLFPLGEIQSKDEVRRIAKDAGFPTAQEKDSQDICFKPPLVQSKPGIISDIKGKVLGEHKGLPFYTVGQREGLGVAIGRPLYVVAMNVTRNELIVGEKNELGKSEILVADVNIISGDNSPRTFNALVKIRSQGKEVLAKVHLMQDKKACLTALKNPFLSPTPGQFAVFYKGDECFGGGIIS